jgi:hypothetical protein
VLWRELSQAHWTNIRKSAPRVQTIRFNIFPPEETTFTPSDSHALSPDGEQLAFTATGKDGKRRLYLRSFDSISDRPLPGTEGAFLPFWSPDNRWIAFTDGQNLRKVDRRRGLVLDICDLRNGSAGAWNRDDVILFMNVDKLYRIASNGGEAHAVTVLESSRHEIFHFFPQFLLDARHFIYFAWAQRGETTVLT